MHEIISSYIYAGTEILPEIGNELWEEISKGLDVVGFRAFGSVCKTWNEITVRTKEDFLESQSPQVLLKSSNEMDLYYLCDMSRGKNTMVELHNTSNKSFVGCTGGYMIFESKNHHVNFVNPLNRHEIRYAIKSFHFRGQPHHDHIVLATSLSSKSHVLFALSNNKREYKVYHSGIGKWYYGVYDVNVTDIAIFRNKVYLVTSEADFGELKINVADASFAWMPVHHIPNDDSEDLKLIVTNDQLFLVDFVPAKHLKIYELNFDTMMWIKVGDLGGKALFLGGKGHCAMRRPGKWGHLSNCVYYLETLPARCCIYSMEAKLIHMIPLVGKSGDQVSSLGWYCPDQCMKVKYLDMDYEDETIEENA